MSTVSGVADGTDLDHDDLVALTCSVWSERLGLDAGAEDNFFLLGGTSVNAAAIATELTGRLGRRIRVTTVLRNPTPTAFATALVSGESDARPVRGGRAARQAARAARAARAALPTGPMPSPLQLERLQYYTECSVRDDAMINAWDVDGELDTTLLAQALRTVVARHDGLRMQLTSSLAAAQYTGSVADLAGVQARVVDADAAVGVETADPVSDDDALDRLLQEFTRAPFDLADGPRVRLLVVPRGDARTCVALAIDHIVSDPDSLGIVVEEWAIAYAQLLPGADPPRALPPEPPSYRSYCVAQWERVAVDPERLGYWSDVFRPDGVFPSSNLPGLAGPRPRASGPAMTQHRMLAPGARTRIAQTAADHRTTVFNVVLAAVLRAQAARTGRDRAAVIVSVADRLDPSTVGVVGLVATAIPIWVDTSGNPDRAELLARTTDSSMAALENCVTMLTSGVASLSGTYGEPGPGYVPADKRSGGPSLELFVDGLDDTAVPAPHLPGATLTARPVTVPFDMPQGGLLTYLRLSDDGAVVALLHAEDGIDATAAEQLLADVGAELDS